MPPKRRKAADPASAPEPKRRVTRSSTKSDPSVAEGATVKALKKERETPKSKRTTQARTRTTPSKPKSAKSKAPKAEDNTTTKAPTPSNNPSTTLASNVSFFTITSDAVKNPVQCHSYTTPTSTSTSTPNTSSSSKTLIFTHGAGGTLSAPAVVNFCTGYADSMPILAFQGSMNLASRVKGFHACVAHLESTRKEKGKKASMKSTVFGGRSMGARAAVLAASEILASASAETETKDEAASSADSPFRLILISYPLKGPKDDIRDEILLSLPAEVNVLFIIGDRDEMCPLDLLGSVREKMEAKSQLIVVKGADHGMHVKPAKRERQVGEETGRRAVEWVEGRMRKDKEYVEVGDEE